jgi:hypothetical protein
MPARRFRLLVMIAATVAPSGAWLACNPLFGIEEGNLVDTPSESGATEASPESSSTDSPAPPGDGTTGDGTTADASPGSDGGVPCGNIQCGDPLCCFTPNLSPFCWHDGDVACAIQCRNDSDCANSTFGRQCCLNYASGSSYGSYCHSACDVLVCLNQGDCAGGLPCTPRSCDGGTVQFNLCGDASPDPLCH